MVGNPLYMSPEQARSAEQVDARTDVWSLGVLMYQCLTGLPPFASRNYNALMVEIMTQAHRPLSEAAPGVDRSLAVIVEGCLVKERDRGPPRWRGGRLCPRVLAWSSRGGGAAGMAPPSGQGYS